MTAWEPGGPAPLEWLPGNVGGAWRVGETVHRDVGPWTPAVHAYLAHLSDRVPHLPRVVGFDEQGREVLTFLAGRVVNIDSELLSPTQLGALAAWTRALHDAAAGFEHPGPWRYPSIPGATVIGHNDIAPYNVCWEGDQLVGVFDWDLAGPTTPVMELAFIAWNCVPLWRDLGDEPSAERLVRICDGYGSVSPIDVVDAVPARIRLMLEWIPRGAAAGDVGLQRLVTLGEPERSWASLDALIPRLARIRDRLAGLGEAAH
jgi:hypothetical protein